MLSKRKVRTTARWLTVGLALLASNGCNSTPALTLRYWVDAALGRSARTVSLDGVESFHLFLDPDSIAITPILMKDGVWDEASTRFFIQSIRPGDVVVDVGANIGYFTVLFAKLVGPSGRVYAFEPDPSNFEILERNLRLNGLDNVVAEQKALSDKNEVLTLYMNDQLREDSRIVRPKNREVETVEVEAVVFDDYFAGREKRIDLVKVDTQGAEGKIVSGMTETNANNDLVLALEWTPTLLEEFGTDPQDLLRMLQTAKFVPYKIAKRVRPETYEHLAHGKVWGGSANLLLVKQGSARTPAIAPKRPAKE